MANSRDAMLALDRIGVPRCGGDWDDGGEAVDDRIVNNIDGLSYTPNGEKAEAGKPADLEELQRAGITGGSGKQASWYDDQMACELERLRREDELTVEALNYAGVPLKAEYSTSKAAITVASECRRLRGDLSAVNRDVEALHAELDAANRRAEAGEGAATAYPESMRLAFRVIENHLQGHQITNGVALALSVLSDELSP